MEIPLSLNMDSLEFHKDTKTDFWTFLYSIIRDWKMGINPIILIVGRSQMGKSTTASLITKQLKEKLGDAIKFEPELHIASKVERFLELIRDNKNTILVNEESEDELYSGNWNSLENKLFHKVLVSQGKQHNIYILILHRYNDLDKKNRLKVNYIVAQRARGFAKIKEIANQPEDPEDKIKFKSKGSISYDTDMVDVNLWKRWESVVDPIKDKITSESIEKLHKKSGNIENQPQYLQDMLKN